jgi:PilZ domain
MPLDTDRVTEAAKSQSRRCAVFGATVAKKIRAAAHCQFALLPHEELARLASGWYEASAQAMLSGNYVPLSTWTQEQARRAAGQNFELEDVLELLRICRGAAIQGDQWREDALSVIDDTINDALRSLGSGVVWAIPGTLTYVSANAARPERAPQPRVAEQTAVSAAVLEQPEASSEPWSENSSGDRRDFGRNGLRFPIRVRTAGDRCIDELSYSENVSRSGLYFYTRSTSYRMQMTVKVTYPYWTERGAINREYDAKVVRLDRMTDGSFGVAVEFTESLGARPRAGSRQRRPPSAPAFGGRSSY